MKIVLLRMAVVSACVAVAVGCSGEKAKEAAAGVTKKTVELTKGAMTGIDEGIEEGRKAAQSTDGALIVSTKVEFDKVLTFEVLTVSDGATKGTSEVVVGFANAGEAPVRVTDLASRKSVILLDAENYACAPLEIPQEFTVPANAKQKVSFVFKCESGKVGKIRLFGNDHEIPRDRIIKSQEPEVKEAKE